MWSLIKWFRRRFNVRVKAAKDAEFDAFIDAMRHMLTVYPSYPEIIRRLKITANKTSRIIHVRDPLTETDFDITFDYGLHSFSLDYWLQRIYQYEEPMRCNPSRFMQHVSTRGNYRYNDSHHHIDYDKAYKYRRSHSITMDGCIDGDDKEAPINPIQEAF